MNRLISTRIMSTTTTSIAQQLKNVQEKIKSASTKRPETLRYVEPRLVAASKTQGPETVIEAYDAGQRHFGENYVLELHEKANDIELQDHCEDIRWHLIGHLQRNKVPKVLDVPNLFAIESLDSEKLAKAVNDGWGKRKKAHPLNVMVQCNTSKEDNKSGVSPDNALDLVRFVRVQCPHLNLMGLMTIGAYNYDCSLGPNPDFLCLVSLREEVCKALEISTEEMELSMGMSTDYEHAIELGSTNVRVGRVLFGSRPPKQAKDNASASDSSTSTTQPMKDLSIS